MEEQKFNSRTLLEIILISTIIVILTMITSFLPTLATVILPIPIIILYLRRNISETYICIIITIIALSLATNPHIAVLFAAIYGLIGIGVGYCVKNNKSAYRTFITTCILTLLSIIVAIIIYTTFIDKKSIIDLVNEIVSSIQVYTRQNLEYIAANFSTDMSDIIATVTSKEMIVGYIPVVLIMTTVISSYLILIISNKILKSLKMKDINVLHFSNFYVSNLIGAFLIAILAISIIIKSKEIADIKYIITITTGLVVVIFLLNGMATISYVLRKKTHLSKIATIIVLVVTYFMGLGNLYAFLGLVEMIFDFRKLDPHRIFKK